MSNATSQSVNNALPRAFARVHAVEVTQVMQEQGDRGLFLTIVTDPERPEPEFPVL